MKRAHHRGFSEIKSGFTHADVEHSGDESLLLDHRSADSCGLGTTYLQRLCYLSRRLQRCLEPSRMERDHNAVVHPGIPY